MPERAEEWRAVPGFDGIYEVSSHGRVRRVAPFRRHPAGFVLSLSHDSCGYPKVALYRGGKRVHRSVHRLVALAFIGEPHGDAIHVCHFDGDPNNNRVENLRWGTREENEADKARHGRVHDRPQKTGRRRCALHGHAVAAIRRRVRNGELVGDLARKYRVAPSTIRNAAYGRTYGRILTAPVTSRKAVAA